MRSISPGLLVLPQWQVAHGVPKYQAYNVTMYIMAGLLVIGTLVKAIALFR